MNKENRTHIEMGPNMEPEENHKKNRKKKGDFRWKLALMCMCAMMLVPSASATGESTSGLSAVLAQSTNATTLVGAAFDLITGNPYLALMCFFGLLGAAIRLFRRGKRAAR